jgi:hypothetical protein
VTRQSWDMSGRPSMSQMSHCVQLTLLPRNCYAMKPAILLGYSQVPWQRLRSERRELLNAPNGRTERESSEYSLMALTVLADFDSAIRRYDRFRPSQAVWPPGPATLASEKRPQTAGFRAFASRLQAPMSTFSAAELPKVSDRFRGNSRFGETGAGDFGSSGHCVPTAAVDFVD